MRLNLGAAVLTVFGLVLAGMPMLAHHSFAAEYDSNKPITVKGTINKLMWVNPHAYVYIDVKDEQGKVVTWAFETLSPSALARQGWNRKSLVAGEEVTIDGYLAKDGKPLADGALHANSRLITKADGKKVFQGSSADEAYAK